MKHKNIGKRILTLLLCISLLLPNTSGYVYALEDTIPLTNAEVQDGTIILNEATDEIFADEVLTEELSEPAEEGETTPEEETTEETSEAPAEEMPVEGEDGVEDSEESEVTGPTEEMPVEGENNAEDSQESEDTESSEETPVEGEDNAEDSEESEVTEPTEETLMEGEEVVEESEAVVTDEAGEIESVDEVNIMSVALVATDALDEMCKDIFGLEDYAAFQANEGYREVYVANETPTEDSSASGSASHPFTSLDEAYEHIEVNGEGGIIHLSGDAGDVIKAYTKETTIWPNNEVPVIIVSDDYENAYLTMSSTSLDFNANVGFYNVKIKLGYESGASKATLFANGNTLVFGGKGMNNFAFENDAAGTRCYPTVFGASSSSTGTALAHSSVENTTLKIYAGTFSQIFGGGEFYSDVTGTANVVVDGYIAAENGKGAVAFSDTNLAYMEKGHHIYGGGASKYTSVNEREYAHTENANVSLSYIETTKSVTAHGGIVNSTSVLNVDHCIIGGYVNARSEGAPASEVTMNISHSEIKGSVGAIGGTEGGVSKANKMEKTIDNLTINVNHAEVTGSILLREGALGGGSYNNFVNNATLVVKNSTAGEVRLTWADAINTSYGVLKKLELDTVQATFPDCSGGVGKIESIVLRNMGTEETPFVLSENKFSMIQTARNFGELVLENSHVNYISGSYTAEKLEMLDSSIKFDTGRVFKTEKFVASGNNTLEFTDEAYLEINGTVTESNTVSTQTIAEIPELSVGSRAGIIFNHEPKLSVAKELFTIDTDPTYVGILDNSLNAAFWIAYNGETVEENYVYWDPTGGSDTVEGYSGECREEDLGYDNAYPVKTYAKALEKVEIGERIKAIVLCGYFDVDYKNAAGEFGLTSAEKGSSEITILTSKDSYFDYTGSSGFNFNNTVANTLALFNFNTAIQFEDINFINNGPGVVTLMCNGYKTIMQDGIENTGDFHLYGGSYNANVEKTDLSVLDGRWRRVAGTGKGAESSVGTVTTDQETEVVNLVVDNKITEGTIYTSYVFDGDVYGSVNSTFTLNQNLADNRIYMYVSGCNPGTVTGNFTTTITDDSKNNGDYKAQVYVYPRGITIQGKFSFEALAEQMRYSELILPEGKIGGADINVAADLIARLLLFEANTLIDDKINWTVDGDVKVVAASRENDQLIQNKAQVNVTLKNGEYISINAGTANGSQTAEVSYQNSDSVHLTLFGEGNVTRIFEEVWGFSSITIDGNHIVDLKPEIVTNNLVVSNGANLLLRSNATVGKMSILSGAEVEARTGLTVEGDFTGDEVTPGTLVHNCANELGELQQITIGGVATGSTYLSTEYETDATVLVKGKTFPEQFVEPVVVDENGKQIITVTCEPTVGEVTARIWNVANAKSKRYIYVDGRIDNTSADYASHDGSSPEKAFKTLDEAYEEVLPGGYIIVCGDLDVDVWPENATKKVTITSKVTLPDDSVVDYYSEEVEKKPIFYLKNHIELRADTTFDNLRIQSVAAASKDKDNGAIESGKVIAAMGYKIVMGHEGDKNSLTMVDDKWPSIAGGGYSTQIANQQTEVTIYAGNYGTVAAYQLASTTGIYSTYTSGNVNIYGGTFLEIYAKKNLYDRINGSVTTVNVENATVLRGIYTLGRPYEANATYIFNIGKDMTFADEAVIHMGTRGNYSFGGNIILNMNGTGGKPYRVPMISTTIWEGSSQNQQKTTINLTQVTVGELYGGAYSTQCPTVSNATLDVCLLKNAVVENVYYGGLTDKVSEKVTVTIADNAAKINNLSVTCKGSSNKPEFAVLQFENVGTTDNPYVLDAGINLNGLTSVELINSVVDFTAAGNELEIGELKADDKSRICHEGYRLDVAGNYIASSDDAAPTMWYGKGAPILNFSGTVDGYTKVFSKDVREESIDPGHFYHGIQIYAATNDGNVAENFVDYAGQALQFQKAAEGETADHWWLNDSGEAGLDTYVSQVRGHDLNQGTFAAPVRTLGAAYNNVQKLYESIKENEELTEAEKAQQISALRIILLDDITVEETDNNLSNFADEYSVKITSYDLSEPSGIVFKDSCTKFIFPRDTVADYVVIKAIAQKPEMYAAGHKVVIGENVTTDAVKEHYPRFYGGAEKEVVVSTNLTINGGSWSAVYGGGKNRTATVTGDVKLNVGNKIDMKNVGTYSQPNTGLFGGGYAAPVEGTITLNIDGGNYLRIHGGGEVADTHNIITNLGTENSEADSESAKVTAIFRGSGLNAGLVEGCKAVVNIYTNALVEGADGDKVQFAAGGYSGNLDETVLNIYGGEIYSDIFGGGWGEGTPGAFGNVGSTAVNISGGKIAGNIFGGGNLGNVTETAGTNLLIKGGTISGNIYGGGNQASVKTTNVKFEDSANITGNIFGGGKGYAEETGIITFVVNMFRSVGNAAARLFGADTEPFAIDNFVDANVNETNIVVSGGTVTGNIYGGGELATVNVSGNTSEEPVTNVALNSTAKVNGNVYGGGQGRTGKDYAVVYGNTNVVINGDNVVVDDGNGEDSSSYGAGCVFGGGEIAPVNGSTSVAAHSGIVKNIFGGNDISGNISGTTLVSVPKESTAVIANIYGGGRDAAYAGDTAVAQVRIAGGTVANAYGGGYGATALTKQTDIQISGGTVVSAYGGGNAANSENTHITLLGGNVAEVFGGGNAASVTAAAVITVDSHNVKGAETVYAGNNAAEMAIQPTLTFTSGEIGTFYGGGKAGKMTKEGLAYNLNFENIKINEVYAGCYELPVQANGDAAVTEDVTLTLTAGTYGTVYGANNVQGNMEQTYVIVNELIDGKLKVDTIYGGGNAADTKAAKVELLSGTVGTVYGGGNNATVVKKVELIANGDAEVADMFGGNNQAAMDIVPTIEGLDKGMVTNFYGGGNVGVMNTDLTYTFDSADMKITNLYGGCNEADVYADKENEEYGNVTLTLSGTQVENVFGGCNTSGNVGTTNIIVNGDGATNIYGGGYGEETIVAASDVLVKAGAVGGSIYGGSYNGTVNTTNVTVGGSDAAANAILVEGDVFGGGYGLSSTVTTSNVTVDMPVSISRSDTNADFIVTEEGVQTPSSEEVSSGETKTTVVQNHVNCNTIKGSVYGGGDMGQVGEGSINQSTNSAVVTMLGTSNVKINNGYIGGSVFGGGNGAPAAGMTYTVEMGTVFGSCNVDVTGGYVGESIYGCGNQSRVYADTMAEGKRQASTVNITETDDKAIVVGQSVFGGGNKGDDKKLNASVPTVIGDTVVNITGTKGKATPTEIYFISGGVYGDGHLCLVTGDKTVNMTHFNYGTANRENLKTFYSLQRADVVNLTDTRIVLLGAEDLVDENSDGTVYSINRVEQLNMNDSSAIKLTTVVNLLGGLTSDEYTDRKFIENGKADVAGKLTEGEITAYRGGYLEWKDNQQSSESPSYNVVAVANGRYLEIKKDKDNYGNIAGLFVLELLYANPGEGGGFVYANHDASIGDFICTTYLDTATEEYMDVVDGPASDVSYYYWYIKGGKYTYDVEIIGYIGTSENKFTESARLATFTPDTHYILKSVTSSENNPYDGGASEHQEDKFDSSKLVSEWKNEYNDDNKYAVEVKVHMTATNGSPTEKTLGFLAYENNEWGLKVSNSNTLTGYRDATNADSIKENELFEINEQTTEVKFEFVLYKGTGVDLEIKDVPVTLTLDIFKDSSGTYEPADAESQMRLRTYTSIVRIVPTQAAYLAEGRVYAGIATSAFNINITKDSSFTAQFITRYVPNAFGPVTATLTTKSDEIYLLDETNGIGFTVRNNNGTITKLYDTEGDLDKAAYDINVSDDIYYVKYGDSSDTVALDVIRKGADGFELPKGTVITMISRPDDGDPVYYYYLCNEAKTDIPLTDFVKMNTNGDQASEKYVSPIEPDYGNRVTENMTFIFDFSNVSADWMGDSETLEENIQLKYIATELNGYEGTADIMEYVSETNVDGKASYERVTPEVITGAYFNSDDVINGLSITADKQSYFTNDTYTFTINVNKKAIPTNTRYEEREYAVVLSMVDEVTGAEVPFPTGARFTYDGQTLETCNDNKQVVVPISVLAAGNNSFEVVMETVMAGIDTDSVKIKAQLYSAADAEYFNSINTAAEDSVSFHIVTSTVYALSVVETEDVALTTTNHILVAGETPSLEITTNYGGEVSVTAYSYNSSKKAYEEKNISDVFNSNTDTEVQTTADKVSVWKPMVRENAQGVWRLEFTYYDRTEYWDFIVE